MELIIALDIGGTRTGIAKSDPKGIIIKPLKTVSTHELAKHLDHLAEKYEIKKIIIGLPKNMDNTEGTQSVKVREHAKSIKDKYPSAEIIFEDEKLTSEEATAIIKDRGIHLSKANKDLVDMYAAAIILEQYFSRHK